MLPCHTLAHAGAQGKIGPNLDAAFQVMRDEHYPLSTIREVVAKQIKYPNTDPSTGAPGMPREPRHRAPRSTNRGVRRLCGGIPVKDAVAAGCGEAGSGTVAEAPVVAAAARPTARRSSPTMAARAATR